MVGEGLLASWLLELEFSDVVAPSVHEQEGDAWGLQLQSRTSSTSGGFRISLHKQPVDDISMELVAYGKSFIIATAMNGVVDDTSPSEREWRGLDIQRDIGPCAEGRCGCIQ